MDRLFISPNIKTIILLSIFVFLGSCSMPDYVQDQTQISYQDEIEYGEQSGALIITKLEEFMIDKGKYPGSLQELIPEYVNELPVDYNGRPFNYQLNIVDGYILSFKVDNHELPMACGYLKRIEFWDCSHSVESK